MGTRNLTIVISNNEIKVAQYGQWDGYPSGQGSTILKFLKNKQRVQTLKSKLSNCRFATKNDEGKESNYISRDIGGKILELISLSKDEVLLNNSYEFAADSLFCEWAYVVDLDNNKLEVYTGFNTSPIPETNRFYSLQTENEEYCPVSFVKSFNLDSLPSENDFINLCDPKEAEEKEEY